MSKPARRYFWQVTFDGITTYGVVATTYRDAIAAAVDLFEQSYLPADITKVERVGVAHIDLLHAPEAAE
jgi:hypothetical protein